MAVEKITMWKTSDGKLHKTVMDAAGHVSDRVCETISNLLAQGLGSNSRFTANDLYTIVVALAGDYPAAKRLVDALKKAYDEIDTGEDCG